MNAHAEIRTTPRKLATALRKADVAVFIAENDPDIAEEPALPAEAIKALVKHIAAGNDEILVTVQEHRSDDAAHVSIVVSRVAPGANDG